MVSTILPGFYANSIMIIIEEKKKDVRKREKVQKYKNRP